MKKIVITGAIGIDKIVREGKFGKVVL